MTANENNVAGCCRSVAGILLLKLLSFKIVADVAGFQTSHIVYLNANPYEPSAINYQPPTI
jgi:hypothetical protein